MNIHIFFLRLINFQLFIFYSLCNVYVLVFKKFKFNIYVTTLLCKKRIKCYKKIYVKNNKGLKMNKNLSEVHYPYIVLIYIIYGSYTI